jgi:hypothetical protein
MDWSWVYRRVGGEGVDKEVASSFVSSNESYRYRWLLKRNWSYQPADAIEFIASVILQRATRPKKKITPPPLVMSAGLFRVSFSSLPLFPRVDARFIRIRTSLPSLIHPLRETKQLTKITRFHDSFRSYKHTWPIYIYILSFDFIGLNVV